VRAGWPSGVHIIDLDTRVAPSRPARRVSPEPGGGRVAAWIVYQSPSPRVTALLPAGPEFRPIDSCPASLL
jgi:hypothetical protein